MTQTWGERAKEDRLGKVNDIKVLAEQGMTAPEVSRVIGVGRRTMDAFLDREGEYVKFHRKTYVENPDTTARLQATLDGRRLLAEAGLTCDRAAELEGISVKSLGNYSKIHGLVWA